jgi:hypothetical protein
VKWLLDITENVITLRHTTKKYIIGLFEKKKYRIKSWREVIGKTDDDAFYHLMNDSLFDGKALKDIIDEIDWLES